MERPRAALALLDLPADVGRVGQPREGQRRRDVRDRLRRLAAVELGGGLPVGHGISDASSREPERLRERPEDDDAVVDEPRGGDARVLEVRLVHDERARGRELTELTGRVVRATAERHDRIGGADLGAGELRADSVQRIRRLRCDRDDVSRPGERARAQEDEVVGACSEHDVLGLDARIPRDALHELRKATVRVPVHLGERARDRPRAGERRRLRRDVAVEADDLGRVELHRARDLLGRRRPHVLGERRRQRSHRCTAAACAGMFSAAASASTVGRSAARPFALSRWVVTGFRNVSSPMPPTARARPPVGRTWLPPVA